MIHIPGFWLFPLAALILLLLMLYAWRFRNTASGRAFLTLVFVYTGQRRARQAWLLLAILPLATNLVIRTNPLHHWFYGSPRIDLDSVP